MLETYLDLLDVCYFEVTEAFGGLADDNVWKRPAPGLLSVGELAGHIAYWEAIRFTGPEGGASRDLADSKVKSPLLDERFRYYTSTIDTAPTQEQLALTAPQVQVELLRIHQETMECLKASNLDLSAQAPEWHSNYGDLLKYVIFHISYHTGQMYSVRHLLGEVTPDN